MMKSDETTMRKRVLFICTANLQRSPTAENLFQNWRGRWEAKSAGIMPVPEGTLLTQELIDWADLILVMEPVHAYHVNADFKCDPNKVKVLNIADRYFRDDPELIRELRAKVTRILDSL
jgi:predicted protein tyrosine phosphatase